MGEINLSIHPLFFLFGLYYSLTGRFLLFIIYTITAVLHELGHSFIASKQGYLLKKITLMPFGAVISGESDFQNAKDEIKIAFAGPIFNLCIGLFFVALWWIFPVLYPYTDIIVEANFSLAIINFLPFFPLDGGRIMFSLLSIKKGRNKALLICKVICLLGVIILITLFIISIFNTINISILFFALFLLFSLFDRKKENKYVKLFLTFDERKLKKGLEYKKIAIDSQMTIKRLMQIIDTNCLNEVVVFSNNKKIGFLSQEKIEKLISIADINKSVDYYLKDI